MKNPFLLGERLYLRPIEREDAPIIIPWLNDPEVRAYLRLCRPFNVALETAYIEKMTADDTSVLLLLILKEGDRPIGILSLHGAHDDLARRHVRPHVHVRIDGRL